MSNNSITDNKQSQSVEGDEDVCAICGDCLKEQYSITLKCNHKYHYECIQKTFLLDRKKRTNCPLCSCSNGVLPLVNGLTKLYYGIHYIGDFPTEYTIQPCTQLLKSGKRKGCECGSKPMLGFTVCKRHNK